jgi:glycosyltransferase involved in cell wall biosynthesis
MIRLTVLFYFWLLKLSSGDILLPRHQHTQQNFPSRSNNAIKYQTDVGLTNQLLSFVQAIRIAQYLQCSLVLPAKFKTRILNSYQDLNHSTQEIDLEEVFNIQKLQTDIALKFHVRIFRESEIVNHRINLLHPLVKYSAVNKSTIEELKSYLKVDNTILDVGPLYLRMIDVDCQHQRDMAEILHLLLDSLADPLSDLVTSLLSFLDSKYNGVHLTRPVVAATKRTSNTAPASFTSPFWDQMLSSKGFPSSLPLYVACSDCTSLSSRQFKYIVTRATYLNNLPPSLKAVYLQYSSCLDVMALLDLKILIGAQEFAGSHLSAFSHLTVSERLYLDKQSTNLCITRSQPVAFTRDFQTLFGRTSPDVTCSHLAQLQSTLETAAIREIIDRIPALFEMMHVENSAFNSLVYLLSYEPASYALPLVYTYLQVPYGDKWQVYSKVQEMFDKPGKRNLIMCALEVAMGAQISRPVRILMVLHNSMMQGASLMAFYLAKMYKERLGIEVNFFIPSDSRGKLEVLMRKNGMKAQGGKKLTSVNLMRYNAVYLNTIVSWYHEYFPKYVGLYRKMCILYVHESLRQEIFRIYPSAEEVLDSAKALVFVSSPSRMVYQDIIDRRDNPNNFVIGNSLSPQLILDSQMNSEVNGIRDQLGITPSDLLYVISGDVYPNRNQAVFVEAAIRLLDYLNHTASSTSRGPSAPFTTKQVFFLVIGFTEITQYVKDIYKRVQESPYHSQFILRDKMPHQTSLEYMAAGDVYVSLALKESFGLALLEAMTMAIPVIVAKLDGVPDVIYEEALDVDPTSPSSVYEAMRELLPPATRAYHSVQSQRRSEFFKQQFYLIRHLDVLRRVLWLPNA